MDRTITVKISQLGKPTVEAHGFEGTNCAEATKPIEDALSGVGGKTATDYKPEWNNAGTEAEEEQSLTWG